MAQPQITTLLRFEEDDGVPPVDVCGGLKEMFAPAGCTTPVGAEASPLGRALTFTAANSTALASQDLRLAGTLLQRDLTVIAIARIDLAAQAAAATTGTIIARGKGNSATEYMPFALELRVVDAASKIAEVRLIWHTIAGVLKTQVGGMFTVPDATSFVMLTATRRWVHAGKVVLRYYAAGRLLVELESTDGDIGGGTTGTTSIGARYTGAAYANFFAGSLDEIALANYEMAPEEIAIMWERISKFQPDGYQVIAEYMPPGMPISDDPASRPQTELRAIGQTLGIAMAAAENVRRNMIPTHAYGQALADWEDVAKQPPKPGDSLETRRARVIGQLRKHSGCDVEAVAEALADLLQCGLEQLEIIAFDNTIRDAFAALDPQRWSTSAGWDCVGGQARVQAPMAGAYQWDASQVLGRYALVSAPPFTLSGAPVSDSVQIFGSVDPHALPPGAEAGFMLYDFGSSSMLFVGLRNIAGAYTFGYQRFTDGIATDGAFQPLAVTALTKHWVRIRNGGAGLLNQNQANFEISWSTAGSAESDFTTTAPVVWKRRFLWAGMYFRSVVSPMIADVDARFGDFALRLANGTRPFYWYVYRDPALPGAPDIEGARRVLRRMRQANTYCDVITSKSLLTADPASVTNGGPMGAL